MAKRFPKLDSEAFLNWLTLGLAIHYTKEGIESLVIDDAEQFQEEILKEVYTQRGVCRGTTCCSCSIENVIFCPTRDFCNGRGIPCSVHAQPGKKHKTCPNNICEKKQQALCVIATEGDCIKKEIKETQIAFLRDVVHASKAIDRLTTDSIDQIVLSKVSAIDETETVGRKEKRAVAKARKDLKRKAMEIKQESKRIRKAIHKEKESAVRMYELVLHPLQHVVFRVKEYQNVKTIQN